jgi:hypothetical protein
MSLRTVLVSPSPLRHHISGIVRLCTQKQVVGAHARWGVAAMQDAESFGDHPVGQFPSKAVGADQSRLPDPHHTVSITRLRPFPQPAFPTLIHPFPQTFSKGAARSCFRRARQRAVRLWLVAMTMVAWKRLAAMFTGKLRAHRSLHFGVVPGADPLSGPAFVTHQYSVAGGVH